MQKSSWAIPIRTGKTFRLELNDPCQIPSCLYHLILVNETYLQIISPTIIPCDHNIKQRIWHFKAKKPGKTEINLWHHCQAKLGKVRPQIEKIAIHILHKRKKRKR